jgi:BirA family biotin operon repressor/biotin-[acetyl-CoA-carboxylase] ligase
MRMLADGEFHSGSTLAHALGVSRGTIWNAVRALGAAGLEVYSVKARGYRLAQPLSVLDASEIARHAGPAGPRLRIEVVDVADSTNTLLMQRAARGERAGTALVAEWQRSGRGRMLRPWHAGLGGAITFSLLWRFRRGAAGLAGLSLVVGLALARTLSRHGAHDLQLKWPNDVLWRGRKLAGVLIEMHGDALGPSTVVIGIGVNVRLSSAVRARIDQAATDLETMYGHPADRSMLIGAILAELAPMLDTFAVTGFAPLRQEWEGHNIHQGRRVTVKRPDGRSEAGTMRGVADDGALVLARDGEITHLHSAEISVRSTRAGSRDDRAIRTRVRSRA